MTSFLGSDFQFKKEFLNTGDGDYEYESVIVKVINENHDILSWRPIFEVLCADLDGRLDGRTNTRVCAGCRGEISDPFFLRVHPNLEFHAACLKCAECARFLDESETTFVKKGHTYCKEDYYRKFGHKCNRCSQICMRSDMVMRAGHLIFHLHCFTCSCCDRRLSTGEQYLIRNGSILCSPGCEETSTSLKQQPILPPASSPVREHTTPNSLNNSNLNDEDSWETSTLASIEQSGSPSLSVKSPPSGSSCSGVGKKSKKDKQTTRVRTVLNENQLLILKKCYALNSRPDALMKEQLVEMTGLNARVIRVWFQNKRCKDKKRQIQIRDMQVNAEKEAALSGIRVNGVGPLIASSPTTHVDNLGGPIDIHQYPQWNHGMDQMDAATQYHQQNQMNLTELGPSDSQQFGMDMMHPQHSLLFGHFSPQLAASLSSPPVSD